MYETMCIKCLSKDIDITLESFVCHRYVRDLPPGLNSFNEECLQQQRMMGNIQNIQAIAAIVRSETPVLVPSSSLYRKLFVTGRTSHRSARARFTQFDCPLICMSDNLVSVCGMTWPMRCTQELAITSIGARGSQSEAGFLKLPGVCE